jgi:hypothetical protein
LLKGDFDAFDRENFLVSLFADCQPEGVFRFEKPQIFVVILVA